MQIRCVMQLWFFPMLFHLTHEIRGCIHLGIGCMKRKKGPEKYGKQNGDCVKKGKPHIDAAANFK